jgi:LysM repeat protein
VSAAATSAAGAPPDVEDDAEGELRTFGASGGRSRYDDATRSPQPRRRPPVAQDAPPWEPPRRYEAYPTLRTRTGLPAIPPLAIAAGVVLIAALALFFIPPMLLGIGGSSPSPSVSPSPASSPSAAASPSVSPSPAQLTYVVKAGDTASAIAAQFGISLDQLVAANPEALANPDAIQIGDELVIPTSQPSTIPGQPSASPSPSPSP